MTCPVCSGLYTDHTDCRRFAAYLESHGVHLKEGERVMFGDSKEDIHEHIFPSKERGVTTMHRTEVFEVIGNERRYQDLKWGTVEEHPHEVGAWLTLIDVYVQRAKLAWTGGAGDRAALEELRKVLAIGTACAEQHGLPER